MEHTHQHDHSAKLTNSNTAFIVGISLNLLLVIIQVVVGLFIHSLSLLSDAGHNFADVGSLAISLLAFQFLKVRASKQYTYGYRKVSVLTALFNAMVLLVSIGAILYEAAHRVLNPEPIPGFTIALVSGVGIIVNVISAFFFLRDKDKDLNIESAYLHLMSDAIISIGLVIGGIIIHFTNWFWIDSLLSVIVAIAILVATWQLFKHIWAISTTENALTAHLVLSTDVTHDQEQNIKHQLKHELEHKNIQHITLETERENEPCETVAC
jgi:cobalt-zinc-cadmium efflux system protein